jgi:sodium-dependent dicarboxylate transporter 2/3/5
MNPQKPPETAQSDPMAASDQTISETTDGLTGTAPEAPRKRRAFWIAVAVGLMLLIHFLPFQAATEFQGLTAELTSRGKDVLAVLAFCIVLWVSEAIPFTATALLGLVLLPVFGVYEGDMTEQFTRLIGDGFGNKTIVFILGLMIMATGIVKSGTDRRIALLILRVFGNQPRYLLLGFLTTGCLISMWLTDMAAAAILLPVGIGILNVAGCRPLQSNFGRGLMIAVAWGPLFGGIATPAGTAANPVALAFLDEIAGIDLSFAEWMKVGVPTAILLVPVGWLLLLLVFPPEIDRIPINRDAIAAQLRDLGPLRSSPAQIKAILVPLVAIVLWLGFDDLGMAWIAIGVSLLLFLPYVGFLKWSEAESSARWGSIVLVAAGIGIGMAAHRTGLATYVAYLALGNVVGPLPEFLRYAATSWVTAGMHAAFSSNTLTGSIMAPLVIPFATALGTDVWATLAPAAFTSSLAFILVTEGPTSIIAHSSGYFSIRDFAKAGILMTAMAGFVVAVSLMIFLRF